MFVTSLNRLLALLLARGFTIYITIGVPKDYDFS